MNLPEYKTLSEKKEYFVSYQIDDWESLKQIIDQYYEDSKEISIEDVSAPEEEVDYNILPTDSDSEAIQKIIIKDQERHAKRKTIPIFRGMHAAKYKLYTSSQRYWVKNSLSSKYSNIDEFIKKQIDFAKSYQNNLLENFYSAFNHKAYDLSILGFLQHYGAGTPILDWSHRFNSALFFAFDGLSSSYDDQEDGLEKYVSVYMIDLGKSHLNIPNLIAHINKSTSDIDAIIKKYKNLNPNHSSVTSKIEMLDYSYFSSLKLFYMPGYLEGGQKFLIEEIPDFEVIYNQHNLNIIAQKGCFMFNNSSDKPLEEMFLGPNNDWDLKKITCYNVHKNLETQVRQYLDKININKAFMFPEEEKIAKIALNKSL
ncbi:FRG domain-containing protein [Xanthocytophaga agilis]|uniref:FRG domain-containing protein n=1 Tax=Xanthocytophaga agilis TaxID=3048010 RepID=A0AAE3RC30_9BACT|nr:FRG domain-containing protein [Xanthocytophaga agilis]MDJ1505585.1 FRG domain-containing protein [Xanthocytophaga agilis]